MSLKVFHNYFRNIVGSNFIFYDFFVINMSRRKHIKDIFYILLITFLSNFVDLSSQWRSRGPGKGGNE